MSVIATPKLSKRQYDVLERIDRRVPIKIIANEMGVSEARVNQHIRALKDKFAVESMNELVECFRATQSAVSIGNCAANDVDSADNQGGDHPYRKPLYTNAHLASGPIFPDHGKRNGPGEMVFSDAHHVLIDAPWGGLSEPVVVPQFLDGHKAVMGRSLAMVAIAFGIVAAIVLVVSAAITMSEVLDGRASIPTHEAGA